MKEFLFDFNDVVPGNTFWTGRRAIPDEPKIGNRYLCIAYSEENLRFPADVIAFDEVGNVQLKIDLDDKSYLLEEIPE